ncbi:MAG TPA: hypothetical protein PKC99_01930 [Anaerolineales bacterium]|jgi:hypothetical protein|nr:hypothetical protein [Anaerolineales bacterium]
MIKGHGFACFGKEVDDLANMYGGKVTLELYWIRKHDPVKQGTRVGIKELILSVPALVQQILCSDFLPAQDERDLDGLFC